MRDRPFGARFDAALDGRRGVLRGGESTLGNLIADTMRLATDADAALINGGGIRGDRLIPPGSASTRRDLMEILPFGNVTVVVELDGATLRETLEHGVGLAERGAERGAGRAVVSQPIEHVARLGTIAPRIEGRILERQ